jgi:site-specific DNA-methyltransferase (adenine-specific)/modification methylase
MSRFREEIIGDARLILGDCREVLPAFESRFDALVTDPPYGIGEAAGANASRGNMAVARDYGTDAWDDEPADEALRLAACYAHWQIIFGGNYYELPPTSCWLVWDKINGSNDFADCELAWTNLPKAVRRLRYMWNGMLRANGEERGDHPTQKPIGVMKWVLQQLPLAERPHVLDPFMGSGTTGVACVQIGLRFTGIEREPKYFDAACRRIEEAWKQPRLFEEPRVKPTQEALDFT